MPHAQVVFGVDFDVAVEAVAVGEQVEQLDDGTVAGVLEGDDAVDGGCFRCCCGVRGGRLDGGENGAEGRVGN